MEKLCQWCGKRPCIKLYINSYLLGGMVHVDGYYSEDFCSEECERMLNENCWTATTEFKHLQIAHFQQEQEVDTFNSLLSDIKIDV